MFLVTQWINGRVGPGPRWLDPKTTAPSSAACPGSWAGRGRGSEHAVGGGSVAGPEELVSVSLT